MFNLGIAIGIALAQSRQPHPSAPAWVPPPTKLPKEFVQAVEFLHRHGMADPRGGELRRATILEGGPWNGDKPVTAFGWVMPSRPGEPRKLVTLKGLAYPVLSVGERATLDEAVGAALEPRYWAVFGSGPQLTTNSVVAAQLLVLGEVERAEKAYVAHRRPPPFMDLANIFLAQWWDQAATAHVRGDAVTALQVATAFEEQRPAYEREALRIVGEKELRASYYGGNPQDPEATLAFRSFGRLDALIVDSRRRLKRGLGPLNLAAIRKLPPRERIARLIGGLDDIARSPSLIGTGDDPIYRSIVEEGNGAVDPLFNALERDRRLSRHVRGMGDDTRGGRYVVPVAAVAWNAIQDILGVHTFSDPPQASMTHADIRAFWRRTREMRPVDRWVYILNDDGAGRRRWIEAARNLFRPSNILPADHSYRYTSWKPGAPPPPLWFRTLSPSVQAQVGRDLISRALAVTQPPMSRESWATEDALSLARHLAVADPRGGRAAIEAAVRMGMAASLPTRYGSGDLRQHGPHVGTLVAAIGQSGNDAMVDRYLAWLDKVNPEGRSDLSRVLEPLVTLRHDPIIQRRTKRLFTAESSPWNLRALATSPHYGTANSYLYSPLLRLDLVRDILLDLLDDQTVVGHASVDAKGNLILRTAAGEETQSFFDARDPLAPKPGEVRPYRICDQTMEGAYALGQKYFFRKDWPTAHKDRLIQEAKAYLLEQGSGIADRLTLSYPWD
ncbi:MAG: hypothetical protein ACO1SV_26295 [Fimbriimonas sp.]